MRIILDTHIWIWLLNGDTSLTLSEREAIESSAAKGNLFVPAISVWEVSMLMKKGRISISVPCQQWIHEALALSGINLAPLSPDIAVDSSFLPGEFHGDPADRMIVSTTRVLEGTLVTHDQKIIEYGKLGYAKVFTK